MLIKLNKFGKNEIRNICADSESGDKLFVDLCCEINNKLLHQAQLLPRLEYIKWFRTDGLKFFNELAKRDEYLTEDCFCSEELWLLTRSGKQKILEGIKYDLAEFRSKCFLVEGMAKKEHKENKEFYLKVFDNVFTLNDFY